MVQANIKKDISKITVCFTVYENEKGGNPFVTSNYIEATFEGIINPGKEKSWLSVFDDIKKELNDDDLGKQFYERLISISPYKLIDFDNPNNKHVPRHQLPIGASTHTEEDYHH